MKKDESFLGKLGGTLARKKKAKEGESAGRRPPAAHAPRPAPRAPGGRLPGPARSRLRARRPESRRDPIEGQAGPRGPSLAGTRLSSSRDHAA